MLLSRGASSVSNSAKSVRLEESEMLPIIPGALSHSHEENLIFLFSKFSALFDATASLLDVARQDSRLFFRYHTAFHCLRSYYSK